MTSLLSALVALVILSIARRDREQIGVAFALLGNWVICALFGWLSATPWAWQALFAIDFMTAVFLVVFTDTRMPLVIIGLYLVECIAHAATGALGPAANNRIYAQVLLVVAWAQVAVVGGWLAHSSYRRRFGDADPVRGSTPVQPGRAVVEGAERHP